MHETCIIYQSFNSFVNDTLSVNLTLDSIDFSGSNGDKAILFSGTRNSTIKNSLIHLINSSAALYFEDRLGTPSSGNLIYNNNFSNSLIDTYINVTDEFRSYDRNFP